MGGQEEIGVQSELSHFADTIPALVWTALPDGQIEYLNQRWCEYTGLTLAQARGLGWRAAIYPDDLPRLLERWRSMLASCRAA